MVQIHRNLVFSTAAGIFCLTYFLQVSSCNGQLLYMNALANEFLGRSTTYMREGGLYTGKGCTHRPVKIHFSIREMSKFTTCIKEMARHTEPFKDYGKRVDEIIRDYGYPFVTYNNVTSEDGYVQTIFRITGSEKSAPRKGKPAVLLFHGALVASDIWFLMGERSLAFILADAGYEVWLVNARGTDYSQRHLKWNPNTDIKYWDYSYHEMAVFDLPMYISLALKETGTEKVFFIGYSMGAEVLPAMLAEKPELNDKIHCSFLYGGGIFIGDSTTPGRLATVIMDFPVFYQDLFVMALGGRFRGGYWYVNRVRSQFCSATAITCGFCGNALFATTGYDFPQINYARLPSIMSRVPNTISIKFWIHTAQNYRSCKFAKYDYGVTENMKRYGQVDPPSYNLKNVRAPIYLYYGKEDDLVTVKDLEKLRDALPNGTVKAMRVINWEKFNHFDFPMAKDADILVYNRILDDLKEYL